jgi:ribonucleoside-diphosphate reductase alpha chain
MPDIAPFGTEFAHSVAHSKYMKAHGETHWEQLAARVASAPMRALESVAGFKYSSETEAIFELIRDRKFMPGGRYLYACGNDFHQVQNCLLLRCKDSREGWADAAWKAEMSLLTGAGIGIYWGEVRPGGTVVSRTGGVASGPLPKAIAINEQGRAAVQGGDRRAAIWGGLPWYHTDVFKWINAKQWPQYIKDAKAEDYSVPAALDMTNISVCLDDAFFAFFEGRADEGFQYLTEQAPDWMLGDDLLLKDEYLEKDWVDWAQRVYWSSIDLMTTTGEPGFSVDTGDKWNEKLRNACTEIVSEDDSDICNLGGLVISRFDTPEEFGEAVSLGVLFLTAGTVYSDLPYPWVGEVRDKNRRLGLDILGAHEFLLQRGLKYGTPEAFEALDPYMHEYAKALEHAHRWQREAGLSLSVAATSGAPTGTRGIVAETTTGWEPVTYTAYKRTVITSKAHESDERTDHYVVDPTVKRLLDDGYILPTDDIEDSSTLALQYERRFAMQEYAQRYTDQAISMTINLPHVMTDYHERGRFGDTLYKYLPNLRGITVYPDGAIPGQPIVRVPLAEALGYDFAVEEDEAKCASGACGL